ncbi:MAG TPA: RNA methyltransferase [Caulobacteraceae bacterium]|jgi:tRNA/rRNA methyltransferase|nr:RNA methyltransferase [Caulobacteraceae bacterium]
MKAHPPCVILDAPQLAENIGAVARAMANFGLSDLRLVRPRDGWPQPRAWPAASGAESVLEAARVFDTLPHAIADLTLVLATTARPREAGLPVMTPREAAAKLAGLGGEARSGLLFGGERAGLETADVALCQGIITIPVDPARRSLNLGQAVIINAYEWRMTFDDRAPQNFPPPTPSASGEALMGLYEQLEAELDTSGFFHPPEKREAMVRNLRAALGKAGFTDQEVRTLRGVVTALSRGRGKVLAKIAAARAAATGRGDSAED